MIRCNVCGGNCRICGDDGWIAYPTFADAAKTIIRIRKVRCPHRCPLKDPTEPNVLDDYPKHEEGALP